MSTLPTFEEIRRNARNDLSSARDWLKSDWSDKEISDMQATAKADALRLIAQAKAALDRAAP